MVDPSEQRSRRFPDRFRGVPRWVAVTGVVTVGILVVSVLVGVGWRATSATGTDLAPGDAGAQVLRISPTGTGDGIGADWSRAAPLSKLPELLAAAGPGTQILLRADEGPYELGAPMVLRAGGTPEAPVVIRGVNGGDAPAVAELVGSRADPYRPNGPPGKEAFRLLNGSDNLVFEDLSFRNIGNGCFRVGADLSGLTLRRITATNVRRFVENHVSSGNTTATISGMRVSDVTVTGYSRAFARIDYDSHDIEFTNVHGDSAGQDRDNFAQGIQLAGTTHAVLVRRASMRNAVDTNGRYWNGDGFSAEGGTYDIRFEDTYAAGNTDAGYDLKTKGAVLVNAVAEDNKRNFRFWGEITVESCRATGPNRRGGTGSQAQVHTTGSAQVMMRNCTFVDDSPQTVVFDADMKSQLTVESSSVEHAPDGKLQSFAAPASIRTAGVATN